METQTEIFYRAMLARDYRFDGKFFVGVKTTGVYCRPICPAKPKLKNVEFFRNSRAAEREGYRPCLRCRPESAPLSAAWIGKSVLVKRALRLISENRFSDLNEEDFALKLGVSARHLRRLFDEELGKSPKQIAIECRLDFARKLLTETKISVTEIALSSGFSSIRRFNDAMKSRFRRAPRELRRSLSSSKNEDLTRLSLSYRPPFDWISILRFHRNHMLSGIENVDDKAYERVFRIDGVVGSIKITHDSDKSRLNCEVSPNQTRNLWRIVRTVRHMFDLDSDPILIANSFSKNGLFKKLVEKYPGVRLPRGWDPFETLISSILGQLVSTERALQLVQQLVYGYGEKIRHPLTQSEHFLFPTPEVLASQSLSLIGTTSIRKETIRSVSKLVLEKKLSLESAQDPVLFRETFLAIKGIGPWTSEYVALRAIGDTDAFPGTDLILQQVLKKNPKLELESLSPWRAYGALYLWKEFAPLLTKKKEKKNEPVLPQVQ